MFSHVFELTKETHENNDTPAETQTEIVFHSISNSSNDREVQYNVHLEKEDHHGLGHEEQEELGHDEARPLVVVSLDLFSGEHCVD